MDLRPETQSGLFPWPMLLSEKATFEKWSVFEIKTTTKDPFSPEAVLMDICGANTCIEISCSGSVSLPLYQGEVQLPGISFTCTLLESSS